MPKFLKTALKIGLVLAVCVMVSFAIGTIYSNYKDNLVTLTDITPPFVHNGDGKMMTTVKTGQDYFVRIQTQRLLPCTVVVTYYFQQTLKEGDFDRRILWYPYPVYRAHSSVGSSIVDRFIVIPNYMKPGNYELVRQAEYTCGKDQIDRDISIPLKITK